MAMGTNSSKPAAKKATAAKKAAAAAPETPERKAPQREAAATVTRDKSGDIDRVASVSRLADGSPDQTPDFEVLGEKKD